jgi:hypothetical protein
MSGEMLRGRTLTWKGGLSVGSSSPVADTYIVIVYDRWDESSTSFVLGPYDNLQDAQAAWERANEKIGGDFRQHSIQKCRSLSQIPEWEMTT